MDEPSLPPQTNKQTKKPIQPSKQKTQKAIRFQVKVTIEYTLEKIPTSRVKIYTRLIHLSELESDYEILKKHNCICQTDTSEVVWENFFHKYIYIFLQR